MALEVKGIRLRPEDWALFQAFRQQLQDLQPLGTVSAREAFVIAVSSATAAVQAGQPVSLPRQCRDG